VDKRSIDPQSLLFPVPVVLVSCRDAAGRDNLITISWTGIVCSEPPGLSIAVRPSRFSHGIIDATGVFGVNIPGEDLATQVDRCGIESGERMDKFTACGFTRVPGKLINAPLVAECPVNLECRVIRKVPLGSHDVFLAHILSCRADARVLLPDGRVDYALFRPYAYCVGEYVSLGKRFGRYGYSRA